MKLKQTLLAFILLVALFGCDNTRNENEKKYAYEYGDHDVYFSGMHYKVLQRSYGSLFVINITLDSLKLLNYKVDTSTQLATRYRIIKPTNDNSQFYAGHSFNLSSKTIYKK